MWHVWGEVAGVAGEGCRGRQAAGEHAAAGVLAPPTRPRARAPPPPHPPHPHLQPDRKEGGVGDLAYPLVADLKREISEAYGVLAPDGVALRGLFIIDREGIIQHSTINNLAFGRNVDETLRVLQVRLGVGVGVRGWCGVWGA